jgi:hypothetical protein
VRRGAVHQKYGSEFSQAPRPLPRPCRGEILNVLNARGGTRVYQSDLEPALQPLPMPGFFLRSACHGPCHHRRASCHSPEVRPSGMPVGLIMLLLATPTSSEGSFSFKLHCLPLQIWNLVKATRRSERRQDWPLLWRDQGAPPALAEMLMVSPLSLRASLPCTGRFGIVDFGWP